MNNTLTYAIAKKAKAKKTENGALAYSSLSNPVLTLFAQAGALRNRSEDEIRLMFRQAYSYDKALTTKMLFYIGDVRGGLGERRAFQICLNELAFIQPDAVIVNLPAIAFYNRWDSLYSLVDTPCESAMWEFMNNQMTLDLKAMREGKPCSLLMKWMKSINASSRETRELAKRTITALNFRNEKQYRKTLSKARDYLNVVEKKMSANDWKSISYANVPSFAMKNYKEAFFKHDNMGFVDFLCDVKKNKAKINSSTLAPYDLLKDYVEDIFRCISKGENEVTELQWKALPDYLNSDKTNALCMVDLSGSMYIAPLIAALGLGIYFSQRNHGDFHNQIMTFSDSPKFFDIGNFDSVYDILLNISDNAEVGYNTNLKGAFIELLRTAVENKVKKEEMPKALIILSDNEIDRFNNNDSIDFLDEMKREYAECGYDLPKLIFFQVEARQSTFLTLNENAVFISGRSTASFKTLINNIECNAWELLLNTLNDKRYSKVVII